MIGKIMGWNEFRLDEILKPLLNKRAPFLIEGCPFYSELKIKLQ
jgi:hypothetical protein